MPEFSAIDHNATESTAMKTVLSKPRKKDLPGESSDLSSILVTRLLKRTFTTVKNATSETTTPTARKIIATA